MTDLAVRRAQTGDVAAFEDVYRAHVGMVYALSYRLAGSAAKAEELTQDVFVKAWRRLATFHHDSAFSTWLRRLATHAIIDELRKDQRRDKAHETREHAPVRDVGALVDLDRALQTLPEKARLVFVLHDIEGHPHEEIGQMLGITAGTSRGQLHRARSLLQEALS